MLNEIYKLYTTQNRYRELLRQEIRKSVRNHLELNYKKINRYKNKIDEIDFQKKKIKKSISSPIL